MQGFSGGLIDLSGLQARSWWITGFSMKRILVGLSGGVDSSVAAAQLVHEGHEVVGAYMKNWVNADGIPGDCPWEQDIEDAHQVAEVLGIEFRVVDLVEHYRTRVVDYLLEGYRSGITPNPDVLCNREMKFGVFLDYALEQGFEKVATGHYARQMSHSDGSADIFRGSDPNKDQSYFLSLLKQEQIQHALFPVGEMLKPQVRELAEKFNLPTAGKKDSQGICFIGQVKMSDFLRHYVPDRPGEIVNLEGKVVGQHPGLHLFTLGQRKGHGIASPKEGVAYVVVGKDLEKNQLIVGYDESHTPGLYAKRCVVGSISETHEPLVGELRISAQPRYRAKAESLTFNLRDDGKAELVFDQAQRALTPGQICAFYDGGRLLGGGVFETVGE